jgi:preprotein translocase subunit YajC
VSILPVIFQVLIPSVLAQGGEAPQGGPPQGSPLVMLVIFIGIFYFLVIRPQNKTRNEHALLLAALKKGDRVVTDGGIVGVVWQVDDEQVLVEVSDKIRIPFLKSSVKSLFGATDGDKE